MMRLFLTRHLQNWSRAQAENFEAEAQIRIHDQDLQKLRPAPVRGIIALAALGTLIGAFKLSAPPRYSIDRINSLPHTFVSGGELCIPAAGQHQVHCKPIHFPPHDGERLNPGTLGPVEYRFDVHLNEKDEEQSVSLLLPLIWGESEVYRNGVLLVKGPNLEENPALLPGRNSFRIVVNKPSGEKFGIRALYSPTVMSAADAAILRADFIREPVIIHITLALQLMVVAILAMFWVWSRSQPELLFFVILALIEVVKNFLHVYISDGQTFYSIPFEEQVYEVLRSFSIFLAVPFALTVCRMPLRFISDMPRKYGLHYLGIVVATTIAITSLARTMPVAGARSIGFITASTVFILWVAVPRLIHMFVRQLYSRLALTSLTLFGVMVWYSRLVYDLFHLYSGITTEYNNQLLFFVVMAGLLAFQFGRTESRYSEVRPLVAKETVAKVERPSLQQMERKGFVVLVDIVGWTEKRRRISNESQRNDFSQITLQALFKAFDASEYSVPHSAGDGVIVTCTSEATRQRFDDILRRCRDLSTLRPTMAELGATASEIAHERLIARATIYYGTYDIIFAESRHHRKETIIGDAPEACARIIGNDPDPKKVRVVAGTPVDAFRPAESPVLEAEGKGRPNEPRWLYWEA